MKFVVLLEKTGEIGRRSRENGIELTNDTTRRKLAESEYDVCERSDLWSRHSITREKHSESGSCVITERDGTLTDWPPESGAYS